MNGSIQPILSYGSSPPAGFTFTAGGPSSSGIWNPAGGALAAAGIGQTNDQGAYSDGSTGGSIAGSITPPGQTIHGDIITSIGLSGDTGSNLGFVIVVKTNATVLQNFFSTLVVGAPINRTFTTASATYFNSNDAVNGFANYTVWAWAMASGPFIFGSTVPVSAS